MGMSLIALFRGAASWCAARLDLRGELGASAVEYGILTMLIAAVIIVAVFFLGAQTSRSFSCTGSAIRSTATAGC
jgi:Flp pilus assembly pilin Flp